MRKAPYSISRQFNQKHKQQKRRRSLVAAVLLVVIVGAAAYAYHQHSNKPLSSTATTTKNTQATSTNSTRTPPPTNVCADNGLSQLVLVSINQRHMWACQGSTEVYDTPVITGMENLAADLTPTGTYHIYGKLTNQVLKGCDTTGCWNDPVSYWMPFLNNQYGTYGFHDATWRSPSDFGNISPDSNNASHGCVEMPLAAAKWLYNWAQVGTTVTVES